MTSNERPGQSLDPADSERLAELEQVVERGLATFVQVGQALVEIRDSRLYRETHESFEDYCGDRWSMSKTHANRLVQAAEVARELTPIGVTPTNEAQARELAPLLDQPEKLREAWSDAVEQTGGAPTARDVRAARLSLVETETVDTPSTVEDLTAGLTDRQRQIANKNKERMWYFFGGLGESKNHVGQALGKALKTATGHEIKAWTRVLYEFEKTSRELRSKMKSELDARIAAWEREVHSASGNHDEED